MTLNLKPTKELVQRSDRVKVSVFCSYNLFEPFYLSSVFLTQVLLSPSYSNPYLLLFSQIER